jgi:hypothetical protein
MRKSKTASPIGDLLERYFREQGQEQRFSELKVFSEWDNVVGEVISANARPVSVNQGHLVVAVRNSMWLTELGFDEKKYRNKLNRLLGKGVIKSISFRLGQLPEREKPAGREPQPIDPQLAGKIETILASVEDEPLRKLLKDWLTALGRS